MHILTELFQALVAFTIVILTVVFIHEFGHFYFARLFGVKVDQFSIGFGKALWQRTDKKGTLWKLCLIPLGGYIKMHGDVNPASAPDTELLDKMNDSEKEQSFHFKPIWQKSIIIAAGPMFNYLLAILLITGMIYVHGMIVISPKISEVLPNSPAASAGLKSGDLISSVDGDPIESLLELKSKLALNTGETIQLEILRNGTHIKALVQPKPINIKNGIEDKIKIFTIGITAKDIKVKKLGILSSLQQSVIKTYEMTVMMLKGLFQVISGSRSGDEMGGPIKIAQYSAKSMKDGIDSLIMFIAMISINLGLINLLPIPLLDGGHLMFYAIEAIMKKPIHEVALQYSYKIGLAILTLLMVYAFSNDIISLMKNFIK